MPVVAIPAIAIVLAALLALLLYYGAPYVGKFVSQVIPDWHIPGFDSLRNFVVGEVDAAVAWLRHFLAGLVNDALRFIIAIVTVPMALYQAAVDMFNQIYNAINWIIKVGIPRAVNAAQVWTLEKLAGLAAELYRAIAAARTHAEQLVRDAQTWTLEKITGLAAELYRAIAAARTYAEQLVRDAQTWTLEKITGLAVEVYASINALRAWTAAGFVQAARDLDAAFSTAERDIAIAVSDTEAFAVKVAGSAATAAVGVLTTDIEHALAQTWVGITDEVKALEGVLATDLPDIRAGLDAIPADLADSIPAILTGVGAISIPMLRYLKECGIPNCKNLGGLGNELKQILGLLGDGALLALVVELVEHPDTAAREVIDTLGGLADEIVTETRQLVGV